MLWGIRGGYSGNRGPWLIHSGAGAAVGSRHLPGRGPPGARGHRTTDTRGPGLAMSGKQLALWLAGGGGAWWGAERKGGALYIYQRRKKNYGGGAGERDT